MNRLTIFGLALAGCVLLCAYWLAGPNKTEPPKQSQAGAPSTSSKSIPTTGQQQEKAPPQLPLALPVVPPAPLPSGTDRQIILEAIHTASISYDPVDLPRIQPYLSHPDPEVREAALNGIVTLGHASGAAVLREASHRAASPNEASLLKEKADFLELPSAYDLMKAKKLSLPKAGHLEKKTGVGTNVPQP